MKAITTWGLVLWCALGPSISHADQAAAERAFAAALEARLKVLELEGQSCRRDMKDPSAQDACEQRIGTERLRLEAILASPARLREENERLRMEFRAELLVLLAEVRVASAMLSAESNYDEFTLTMASLGHHLEGIRSRYSIPLNRGDHRALGMPISEACTALYAGGRDWKQLRLATKEVSAAYAARARAAEWEADYFQQHLQAAQLRHADAQRHLDAHAAAARSSIQAATRIAQERRRQRGPSATRGDLPPELAAREPARES